MPSLQCRIDFLIKVSDMSIYERHATLPVVKDDSRVTNVLHGTVRIRTVRYFKGNDAIGEHNF